MSDSQYRVNMAKWAAEAVSAMGELGSIDVVDIIAEDASGVDATAVNAAIYGRVRVEHRKHALADGTVVSLITAVDNNGDEWVPLLRTRPQHSRHTVTETWGTGNWPLSPWLEWVEQTALHDAVFGR